MVGEFGCPFTLKSSMGKILTQTLKKKKKNPICNFSLLMWVTKYY